MKTLRETVRLETELREAEPLGRKRALLLVPREIGSGAARSLDIHADRVKRLVRGPAVVPGHSQEQVNGVDIERPRDLRFVLGSGERVARFASISL